MSEYSKKIFPQLRIAIKRDLNIDDIFKQSNFFQNAQKYEIEFGKVILDNAFPIHKYHIALYNIFPLKNKRFEFRLAIIYGNRELSKNYSSKYNEKKEYEIRTGCILHGKGRESNNNLEILYNDFEILEWNTNVSYQTLKDKVGWIAKPVSHSLTDEFFKEYKIDDSQKIFVSNHGKVQDENRKDIEPIYDKICKLLYVKNKIYIHQLVASLFSINRNKTLCTQVHHIDNNGYNNSVENLLYVSAEQHACIHTFMWDKYYLKDYILNFYRL
ncbi:hypothetical protein EXM22_02080 [Oceanispirochaeta crateris]|uniref:HNH nuclease domain-containing protein n=1 Tax=Oceanispirochaeta crateris TaxID=2518645 RepID=A0A5C1QHT4_9SPIO|nr:hypothetical protein [Oceanispirochaeta crateris]QEN06838.1 hypothetical protein EXM22_02080 [Oceanispirochaeta crateris]